MKCIQRLINTGLINEQNDNYTLLLLQLIMVVKKYGVLTTLWTKKSLPFFPAAYSCLIIGAIKFCAVVNIIKSLLKSCAKKGSLVRCYKKTKVDLRPKAAIKGSNP